MNKCTLIGRLTRDVELKFAQGNGNAVATFTVAVDRRMPNKKTGAREADFVPIVVWGKQAESSATYLSKGKLCGVAGRIQTRNYDAKDGHKVYVTEVIAEEVQFLEWADKTETNNNTQNSNTNVPNDVTPIDDGDIPF